MANEQGLYMDVLSFIDLGGGHGWQTSRVYTWMVYELGLQLTNCKSSGLNFA